MVKWKKVNVRSSGVVETEGLTIRTLEDIAEFDELAPGDVVHTPYGDMLVSNDSIYSPPDGLLLIQRASVSGIHMFELRKQQVTVKDGDLCFENKDHTILSAFAGGHQTVNYDVYMRELQKAGLE